MTSSNILFECSCKLFMKTDCVGVDTTGTFLKIWLKNSILGKKQMLHTFVVALFFIFCHGSINLFEVCCIIINA